MLCFASVRLAPPRAASRLLCVATLLLAPVLPKLSFGQQILEIHDPSLTSNLATSATGIQKLRPRVSQRGVNLDGSWRASPALGMAVAGNPFENAAIGQQSLGPIRIDVGAWSPDEVDVTLPTAGLPWVFSRTHNALQQDSGGSSIASDGVAGVNWALSAQPEIVLVEGETDADDLIVLVYGADRYVEFKRTSHTSSTEWKGMNGAAGCFQFAANGSAADTFTLTDQVGNRFVYFGFDGAAGVAAGSLWKMTDPAGNVAFIGHASDSAAAISTGYDSASGGILLAFDASDNRYSLTYQTLNGSRRITQIKAEVKDGGTWGGSPTNVRTAIQADLAYYGPSDANGDVGNLKLVTIVSRLNDDENAVETRCRYYRYYTGTFASTGTPANPGHPNTLKLALGFEGARRFDVADANFDQDYFSASDAALMSFASVYLEFDSSKRVNAAFTHGQCGCGGAANGLHRYTYATNGSFADSEGYDVGWVRRTVVEQPDGSFVTQYFDETNQGLARVITNADPASATNVWVTNVVREESGLVVEIDTPASVSGYTHSSGAVTVTAASSTAPLPGLIHVFARETSGNLRGFLVDRLLKRGASAASAYFSASQTWTSKSQTMGNVTLYRPLIATQVQYPTLSTSNTGGLTTTRTYTDYAGDSQPLALKKITTTRPAVTTDNNGSGSSLVSHVQLSREGRAEFEKDAAGIVTVHVHANGVETSVTRDADTTGVSGLDSDFVSSGAELEEETARTPSKLGFVKQVARPTGLVLPRHQSKLIDERRVGIDYENLSGGEYFGPARYTIRNQAGKIEAEGLIAFSGNKTSAVPTAHVDKSKSDPKEAVATGTLSSLRTRIYDDTGTQVLEERAYFAIPTSGAGTEGTHYDATRFGYDSMGRRVRVKDATGTIRRTTFDLFGHVIGEYVGTNDHSFSGGESTGPDNMTLVREQEFDQGVAGGNGVLTSRSEFVVDGATGKRTWTFVYDWLGRQIIELGPTAPHALRKFDNLGHVVAVGQYSSTSGLDADDDPTTLATNRVGLAETRFDELGRGFETIRHAIDPGDGSDNDSISELTWFDPGGRVVKVRGAEYKKLAYDRLGNETDEFHLAKDDDTAYADVDDVSGDIVMEQHQTRRDPVTGVVLMQVSIERLPGDYGTGETTGALDTNADGDDLKLTAADVKGRAQIRGLWYEAGTNRLVDSVEFGTHDSTANAGTFDRDGLSVPARSDTALRTSTEYEVDGTVRTLTDPRGKVLRLLHDALARMVKRVRNFDATVNSGNPSGTDVNVTELIGYSHGLRTSVTVDLPAGQTDQVTVYTHGTTKGSSTGDSAIATGHLLLRETYPDSVDTSDVVLYAYNAQGQETWKRDQAGNEFETLYDVRGRRTSLAAIEIADGFDDEVQRITTSFDALGRPHLVTQFDAPTGTGVVDQVRYTYDAWGEVAAFDQDHNSAVGASGSVDDHGVAYTWVKSSEGRRTLQKATMTLPGGKPLTLKYRNRNGLHDKELSRVTEIAHGDLTLAAYDYAGLGRVVRTTYPEPDVFSRLFTGTGSGVTFPGLDRFNRVVLSRWTKDLATDVDFHQVGLSYDRNSSVTSADDSVHVGFDAKYAMDGIDRLIDADEGTLASGSITNRTPRQQLILSHTGNWDEEKLDLNGDGDWGDADEVDDCRTHNEVNELVHRNLDCVDDNECDLGHDPAGNMTSDGKDRRFEWDVFYRTRRVKNLDGDLIAEFRYNGLGHRIAEHADTNFDAKVDGSDVWFFDVFDERWRHVARFREDDTSPKEEFVNHEAGLDGRGGSSYIDLVACRYRDDTNGPAGEADGTLEERVYICQNQHADVVAVISSAGWILEWVRYSAFGVPTVLPGGDANSDGDCDAADIAQIQAWISGPYYDARGDVDLDGLVDSADESTCQAVPYFSATGGLGTVGIISGLHRGWMGSFQTDGRSASGIRKRFIDPDLGRWLSRDPSQYLDSSNLYLALIGRPLSLVDYSGASCTSCAAGSSSLVQATSAAGERALHGAVTRIGRQACDVGSVPPSQVLCDLVYGSEVVYATLCSDGEGQSAEGEFDFGDNCGFDWIDLLVTARFGITAVCAVCVTIAVHPACMCANTPDNPAMNCQRACMMCNKLNNGHVCPQNDVACKQQCTTDGYPWSASDCTAVVGAFYTCSDILYWSVGCFGFYSNVFGLGVSSSVLSDDFGD